MDSAELRANLEQEIKRTQMVLLIRLKNKLTPEQQARLRELKAKARE
jgi:Spy/CpxP family protein refolding chaperone